MHKQIIFTIMKQCLTKICPILILSLPVAILRANIRPVYLKFNMIAGEAQKIILDALAVKCLFLSKKLSLKLSEMNVTISM